jgi:hypothetical protein
MGFEQSAIDCRNCGEETITRPMAPDIIVSHPTPRDGCSLSRAAGLP